MADNKLQLIIEAYDRTKAAFSSVDKAVKGLETGTQKASASGISVLGRLKESWMGLSATAVAAWMAIQKAMNYMELGARALQAEDAFAKTTQSMDVNASEMLEDMKKASAKTIDESHLMQKAIKAMAQDVDPAKIPALFDAARVGAVKAGEDITNVADSIIDAIANQMPRGLRRFGLVTKDEFNAFNKAVAAGAENLNILDIVLANANIQAAKMGVSAFNAAIALQQFNAQVDELKETLGKVLIKVTQVFIGELQFIEGAALGASGSIFRLIQAIQEYNAVHALTPARRTEYAKSAEEWRINADAAEQSAAELYRKAEGNITGKGVAGQVKTQAELDAIARKAQADKAKILADWKKEATRPQARALAKQELSQFTEDENAKLAILKETNKAKLIENETLFKEGVITEQRYLAIKKEFAAQDFENEKITLENIKKATIDAYAKMAGTFTATQGAERNVAIAEGIVAQKKLQGEIDLKNAQLQTNINEGTLDQLLLTQQIAKAKREGELSVLEAQAGLEKEINAIKVQRGEITQEKAAYEEYQWQLKILTLKKETLQIDLRTAPDAEKVKIQAEISALNKLLNDTFIGAEKARISELKSTYLGSLKLSLEETGAELVMMYDNVKAAVENAFKGMTDALTDFVMTGKLNFTDLANSIIRDMVRIMIQASITKPLATAAGIGMESAMVAIGSSVLGYHAGGMGSEPTFFRIMASPDLLPRYHKGLGPGERMTITTDDESTMTPGQRRDFYKLASRYGGGPQNIKVEVINESGQKLQATDTQVRFNAQEMIISVVLDGINRNVGGLRTALGG